MDSVYQSTDLGQDIKSLKQVKEKFLGGMEFLSDYISGDIINGFIYGVLASMIIGFIGKRGKEWSTRKRDKS
jgi:hypothetical protein